MERADRGFTLVEVAIAVAIVAVLATAGIALAMGTRPSALYAAATRFDALLDAARTEARAYDGGVTLAFTPLQGDPSGSGFQAQLYRNRPGTGTLTPLNTPVLTAHVTVTESEILGGVSFALTVHTDGRVAGLAAYAPPNANGAPETTCPSSGSYHLVFSSAGGHADRYIPCRINLASVGPVSLITPPAARSTPGPSASPGSSCLDTPCGSVSAPVNATGQCPTNYFSITATECVNPPLRATPTSLLYLNPGAAPQSVTAHEDYYTGPIFVGSSTCGNAITVRGEGNGTDTTFTISPSAAAQCSFEIDDNRTGKQTISVTTYGMLIVSPTALVFPTKTSAAQSVTVQEAYYAGAFYVSDNCGGYVSSTPSGRGNGPQSSYSLSPTNAPVSCTMTVEDDHGDQSNVSISIPPPLSKQFVCSSQPANTDLGPDRDGVHEDYSTGVPCTVTVAASTVRMKYFAGCKHDIGTNSWTPGVDNWTIYNPTATVYAVDVGHPSYFVALASMTISSTSPVTFSATAPTIADSTGAPTIQVSKNGTSRYTVSSPFVDAGTWNGTTWTPPYAGTFYVGYLQGYSASDCMDSGTGVTGTSLYSGTFSFTATQ